MEQDRPVPERNHLSGPRTTAGRASLVLLVLAVVCLSGFVVRTYQNTYDPKYGWTKMIFFGSAFAQDTLPRLKRTRHYEYKEAEFGYDGQFYAQMALDPSLRDPAFIRAMDGPVYRGRRIGLPAISFALGWAKPRRILQVYALANLLFWFVLLGALLTLFRPWTLQNVLGLSAALLSYGVITSMERALVDLPATALLFLGLALGAWWKAGVFAVALLTRETSLLAVVGGVDWRRPWRNTDWKRVLGRLVVALTPFALWVVYVRLLFPKGASAGLDNFSWPLCALFNAGADAIHHVLTEATAGGSLRENPLQWLYDRLFATDKLQQVLGSLALLTQVVYLWCRPKLDSPIWRAGIFYTGLWAIMGSAVWSDVSQVARVLLPMTVCFYLRLAGERAGWFWPCFVLGSLSIPFGLRAFWLFPLNG